MLPLMNVCKLETTQFHIGGDQTVALKSFLRISNAAYKRHEAYCFGEKIAVVTNNPDRLVYLNLL